MTVPLYQLTDTWNNGATVFTAIQMNVTPTAAANGSKLLDLQLAGGTAIHVTTDGTSSRSAAALGFSNFNGTAWGYIYSNSDGLVIGAGSATGPTSGDFATGGGNCFLAAAASLAWRSSGGAGSGGSADIALARDGVGILGQRLATTPQTYRVYNTFTDASNYERGIFDWNATANVLTIGTQAAGTGTNRNLTLNSAGAVWDFTDAVGDYLNLSRFKGGMSGTPTALTVINSGSFAWSTPGNQANNNAALNLYQVAQTVVGFGSGAQTPSAYFQWAGQARVTADVTFTSNVTLGTVTGLSVNVEAGRTYGFEAYLSFTDAAAGGAKAAIAGTATATAIEYDGWMVADNAIKGQAQATALGTTVASSTTVGTSGVIQIKGTITVNAAGTLLVQAAQNTSNGTATTIKRGSTFMVYDMP